MNSLFGNFPFLLFILATMALGKHRHYLAVLQSEIFVVSSDF